MAGDIVITPSGGAAVTFGAATAGFYRTVGRYWGLGIIQDPEYALEYVPAPGVAGCAIRRHGWRRRQFDMLLVEYVNTTAQLVANMYNNDVAALKNVKTQIVMPDDATYASCEILRMVKESYPKNNGVTFRMRVRIIARQVRLT